MSKRDYHEVRGERHVELIDLTPRKQHHYWGKVFKNGTKLKQLNLSLLLNDH